MKRAQRLGRFIMRFWPLWLPLVLLFALPFTRLTGRIVSDAVLLEVRGWFDDDAEAQLMPAAAAHPADFDLQLWHGWQRSNDYGYYNSGNAVSESEIKKLRARFPAEPLLVAPPVQHVLGLTAWSVPAWDYTLPSSDPATLAKQEKQARASIARGQKLDSRNAFWWVALAQVEWRANRYDAALRALERASNCAYFDDYTLQLARRLIAARERYGAPLIIDKTSLMRAARRCDSSKLGGVATWWSKHAQRARTKGDAARALRWGGAMAKVGDLMQRDPNCVGTMSAGAFWQRLAWKIGNPSKVKNFMPQSATYFATWARQNGRAELARATGVQAARNRQLESALPLRDLDPYSESELWLREGQLGSRLTMAQALVGGPATCLGYLAVWWLIAGLLLWRAQGAPSTRRDRIGVALSVVTPLLALSVFAMWQLIELDASNVPRPRMGEMPLVSLLIFAFVGPPFVLALVCGLGALLRHRERFDLPPRIDIELGLSSFARRFLRWFLPLGVASSVAAFAIGWALWMAASWRDWGNVELLGWLPADRAGNKTSLIWNLGDEPYLLVYGIFMCCLCLIIWFSKWRWAAPARLRPVTHGALRWWKESVGAAMATLAWTMLLAALLGWPLARQAEARLERALQTGELSVISDLKLDS